MPTYWTRTLIPTLRELPSEAEVPSHQLMLRAGYIRKLGSGVYDYLPLGWRSLRKIMEIIRQEMAAAGAVEVSLPALIPLDLYQKTGRDQAYGDNLFRLKDRHGRLQALGPTHEEVVTELVGGYIDSYKQLPLTLFQIQTKFRDEYRPRFGVLRSREFLMKDAYSFHTRVDGPGGLGETYQAQFDAYCRIFRRCGLDYVTVEAESGPIGGSASHEFMVPSPTGEDTILESDRQNYAANVEKCEIGRRTQNLQGPVRGDLEKVATPNFPTIETVAQFLKTEPRRVLKTLVYEASLEPALKVKAEHALEAAAEPSPRAFVSERFFVLAVVRGDHDVNEAKLTSVIRGINPRIQTVTLMEQHDALRHGFTIGYVGPHAVAGEAITRLVVDFDAAQDADWVAGANEVDHHVRHFNWQREVLGRGGEPVVADIRNALEGDPSPRDDGGVLKARKGIEVGHVFKLGTKYSTALEVTAQDDKGERHPMIMGCYGIGVNRILAAVIERAAAGQEGHDANGMILPSAIAPYPVVITTIRHQGAAKDLADKLAAELEQIPGVDVLIDDRDERPGVKFKDADLIGIPLRITLGDKSLAKGEVEMKPRRAAKADLVPVGEAVKRAAELLKQL